MTFPLIGITTYRQTSSYGFPVNSLAEAYILAVSQAGAIPVMIPLGLPEVQIKNLLAKVDGILFSGGGDIDPRCFGGDAHPEVYGVDQDRDRTEIELARNVVQDRIPFLGICRGIQMINVALGGTLYTHLPDQHPGEVHHPYIEGNARDFLAHAVEIHPGTKLFQFLGVFSTQVNSMHHQGIQKLAPSLVETARAPDGLIEAVELPDHPFGVAVQWHPEWLTDHAPMRALFQAFVKAAFQRRM